MADKSNTSGRFSNLFQNLKQRVTGAHDQLATARAKQQFRVPDPEDYPHTPITRADHFTSERPSVKPAELVSRPIRTGFLLTVGVGLALALYVLVSTNVQLLVWILVAFFIALGLDPIVAWIQSWGAPRGVGVAVAVAILLGIVTVFISTLIPVIVEQTSEFVQILPTVVSDFIASDFFRAIDDEFDVATVLTTEVNKFVSDTTNITTLLGGILGVGSAIFNVGFSVLIVVVLTLYFLASLPTIKKWLYRLAPRSRRERLEYLSEKISDSVGHYIVGQTLVATLNGIVAFIAVSIADLQYAALLALFAGFMAFIPLVGAVTGGVIISLLALFAGWQSALIFAAIYFIYLQVEAYVISPRIMQRTVAVPGSLAVIGVIAGGSLLGVLGALMAIPAVAAILVLVREVYVPYQDLR
ncbi:AI-2E family transporter [Enteractinococcus coprophilus]|uniref:AI-2E family transporter n=1 Tax=Enteractinococcus coprophilus TaxID=1027633 RepID=UPI001FEAFF04|nr:AI-2E family transporter [Enteractinococcus coprophilus]